MCSVGNLSSVAKLSGSHRLGTCSIPNREGTYSLSARAAGKLIKQTEAVLLEYESGRMVGLR